MRRAELRPRGVARAAAIGVAVSEGEWLPVVLIDDLSYGKRCVHLDVPGRGPVAFWARDVRLEPICAYCGEHGHSKSRATGKNCPVVARELAERRAAKKAVQS